MCGRTDDFVHCPLWWVVVKMMMMVVVRAGKMHHLAAIAFF